MLLVDSETADGTWADSEDPALRWAMPAGLDVRRGADGVPRFLLARWGDRASGASGGLVQVELDAAPPTAAGAAPIPFTAVRARLALRAVETALISEVGEWRDVPPAASPLVTMVETLDAEALQLVEEALAGEVSAVEVFVEAVAHAVCLGLPVLVVLQADRLAALVPDAGATVDELAAGLRSLPAEAISVMALEGGPAPDRDAVLGELAHRIAEHLTSDATPWDPARYRLPAPPATVPLAYDFRTPRPATVRFRTDWSVTGLFASLSADERAARFPRLDGASPFGTTRVLVVNTVPLDEDGVRSLQVDVTTTGPAGLPEQRSFVFDGARSTASFDAVHPAWLGTPAPPEARAQAVLAAAPGAQPAWPRVLAHRPVAVTGTLVTVTPADVGVRVVTVVVEAAALALGHELVVTVTVGDEVVARAVPTPDGPRHLAYDAPGHAVVAVTADGVEVKRVALEDAVEAVVTVAPSDFVDLAPLQLTVTRADDAAAAAFVAITLEDGLGSTRTLTLDAGASQGWACHRRSKTDPVRYRWQLHWIPRAADGSTLPLASTDWAVSDLTELVVSVPNEEEP